MKRSFHCKVCGKKMDWGGQHNQLGLHDAKPIAKQIFRRPNPPMLQLYRGEPAKGRAFYLTTATALERAARALRRLAR